MGTGQCGARQGPLCGCHHPRLIKGSGCSSCCFQTHSPTLTLTLAARLLHGSGSLVAPGPRGLAEPGAGWQDAVSDDILLVADSDPFPRPQCGVCHTTPSPSQGEVCCPAVWGGICSWKGTDLETLQSCLSTGKGFLLLCMFFPSASPRIREALPRGLCPPAASQGLAVKSIIKMMLSSCTEHYIFKALCWHKLINGEESNSSSHRSQGCRSGGRWTGTYL